MFLPALPRSRFRTKLKAEARCEPLESQRASSVLDDLGVPVPTVPGRFRMSETAPDRLPSKTLLAYDAICPKTSKIDCIDMFMCELSRTATC